MCPIEIVTFLTGFETSTAPQTSNPVADADAVSKGYGDDTYTPKGEIKGLATNLAALKAIPSADRTNNQYVILASINSFYKFNSASSATPDDDEVVQPDVGTGRWIKSNPPGGGIVGTGAAGIETVEQKLSAEKYGVFTPPISNSIGESFATPQPDLNPWLMEDYVDPATSIMLAINPVWLDSTNKNFDGAAGWTLITAMDAANIDAEGTTKYLGATSLSWDKSGGTSVSSGVQFDISAAPLSLVDHLEALLIANFPSVTQFANFKMRISNDPDVETNFREVTVTTAIGGANLNASTGRKNILFDLTGGTDFGTGWASNQLVNSIGFIVTTTNAAQTYTNIVVDSLVFNLTKYAEVVQKGDEFSIYDTSNVANLQFSDATTSVRGLVTLAAALGDNYSGGTGSTVKRSTMDFSSPDVARMVDGLSGDVAKLQTFRKKLILPETVAGQDFRVSVAEATNLAFEVSSVDSTTQIKIIDSSDNSAQFLTGDKYHVFRPIFSNSRKNYSYRGMLVTLSGNATNSTGLTTLQNSGTNSGIVVGDLIVKKEQEVYFSCVAEADDEDFGSELATDDLFLSDFGIIYPKASKLYAHWQLGGVDGLVNRKGPGANLSENGGPTTRGQEFMNGKFAAGPWASNADRFYLPEGSADELIFDSSISSGILSFAFWYNSLSFGTAEALISHATTNQAGSSWILNKAANGDLVLRASSSAALVTIPQASVPDDAWNSVGFVVEDGVESRGYANGVKTTGAVPAHGGDATNSMFAIGDARQNNPSMTSMMADLPMWVDYKLTDADFISIHANGNGGGLLGESPVLRNRLTKTAVTGDKVTIKVNSRRQSDDVNVTLWFTASTLA